MGLESRVTLAAVRPNARAAARGRAMHDGRNASVPGRRPSDGHPGRGLCARVILVLESGLQHLARLKLLPILSRDIVHDGRK